MHLDALVFSPVLVAEALRTFLPAQGTATRLTSALGWLELFLALAILGSQWFLITKTGQSLGKKWCRIKIVRGESRPAGFVHGVLLREWIRILIGLVPFIGMPLTVLDDLFIFRADRRCLHDLIAGTRVVDVH